MTVLHEAHDTMLQHVEKGSRKIRTLAVITVIATIYLGAGLLSQLLLTLGGAETSITINLADPFFVAGELVELVLVLAWLYVGVTDYLFTSRLASQIREVRAAEAELMRKQGLDS